MVTRINGYRLGDWFGEFDALRREIDRVFEESGHGRFRRPFARSAFLPGLGSRSYPLVNLSEDQDAVYLEALAPGLDPASINISVLRDQLTLSGEKKTGVEGVDAKQYHRSERAGGKFARTLTLPSEVDSEKVSAEYKNGVLLITLPKAEKAKPKQISVKAA